MLLGAKFFRCTIIDYHRTFGRSLVVTMNIGLIHVSSDYRRATLFYLCYDATFVDSYYIRIAARPFNFRFICSCDCDFFLEIQLVQYIFIIIIFIQIIVVIIGHLYFYNSLGILHFLEDNYLSVRGIVVAYFLQLPNVTEHAII